MKTIGLLGGVAWPSTLDYYAKLNRGVEHILGSNHSCKCIIYSYDFDSLNPSYRSPQEILNQLIIGLESLNKLSVDAILICSNTMHLYLDEIGQRIKQNVLDIRDCVGIELQKGLSKDCLLLGTKQTMGEEFYKHYLRDKYALKINVPAQNHQQTINQIIFEELINNEINQSSIDFFSDLISQHRSQTIVLACTELNLLFRRISTSKRTIDSLTTHVENALDTIQK